MRGLFLLLGIVLGACATVVVQTAPGRVQIDQDAPSRSIDVNTRSDDEKKESKDER
jgi:uncharacterized protein YceK